MPLRLSRNGIFSGQRVKKNRTRFLPVNIVEKFCHLIFPNKTKGKTVFMKAPMRCAGPVGFNVRIIRTMRNWTQLELVNRVKPPMSSTRIVQIERGYRHRPPTADEIKRLAAALDVDETMLTTPLHPLLDGVTR